jgi:hypothetical protein
MSVVTSDVKVAVAAKSEANLIAVLKAEVVVETAARVAANLV